MLSALIVDDDTGTSMEIEKLLKSMGYRVWKARNSDEAIRTALSVKPDIIIMETVLESGDDGIETARIIKSRTDVPVIFITSHSDREVLERASWVEPDALLLKPPDSGELEYIIRLSVDRNRIERLLLSANERYRRILNTTSDGVCILRHDGLIQYCNERMARILSAGTDEIIGRNIREFLHPDEMDRFTRLMDSCRGGAGGSHELRFTGADGKTMWLIMEGHPLEEPESETCFVMFRDVTEERVLSEKLERNRRFLELLSEINHLAAVSSEPPQLMRGVCRKLVSAGYSYAAILDDEFMTLEDEGERPPGMVTPGLKGDDDAGVYVTEVPFRKSYIMVAGGIMDETETRVIDEIASTLAGTLRRMESERKFEAADLRYRELFENAGDAMFIIRDDRIIQCNRRARKLFRADKDEITGRHPWDLSPEYQGGRRSDKLAHELMERASREGACEFNWTHRKMTGEQFPARVTLNRSGDVLMAIIKDMSEPYRAHQRIKAEHRKFRDLLESIPDATFAIDTEGRVIAWNRAMEKLTGIKRDEIIGRGNREYALPFYSRRTPGLLESILTGEEPPGRYLHLTRDGDLLNAEVHVKGMGKHFHLRASPIYNEKDEVIGAIEIIRDITDYIETEKKLERSRENYRAIFENRATPTAVLDRKWRVLKSNRAFRETLNIQDGFNLKGIIHPDDIHRLEGLSDSGRTHLRIRSNGELLHMIVHRGDLPGSDRTVLSFNDITGLKRSQRRLKRELRVRKLLSEIHPIAVSSEDADRFTEDVLKLICELTGATGGMISLGNTVIMEGQIGVEEEPPEGISQSGRLIHLSSEDTGAVITLRGEFRDHDLRALRHILHYYDLAVNQINYRNRIKEHRNNLKLINLILKSSEREKPEDFLEEVIDLITEYTDFDSAAVHMKDPDITVSRGSLKAPDTIPSTGVVKCHERRAEIPIIIEDEYRGVLILRGDEPTRKREFLEVLLNEISDGLQRILLKNRIIESLHEKDVLLREIHHRVKNNLQIVASLLSLQAGYTDNSDVKGVLQDSQLRVRAMALAHEKIYRSRNVSEINLAGYIRTLAEEMITLQSHHRMFIDLDLDLDEIKAEMDRCIPLGLITNEIISNSIKHAFKGERGRIKIILRREDGHGILTISDDGRGLPQDFDIDRVRSLGMQLVSNLVRQLEGELEYGSREGAWFRIKFPI